ncbi:putative membrane protein YfcA [Pontibacter aydingkolensis]|uniref:TSUP family transporter n=1 Tax=Pontibacter aydingkolensis TaxID=1911536 RepID=UPI001FEC07DF|nr:TSUP family transporter [Pontibacter aydingkolensis]
MFDLLPRLFKLSFDPKCLPLGGLLNGFFGGLTGNQGALHSAFLIKPGLSKEAFIATGVVIACLIDVTSVYDKLIFGAHQSINYTLLAAAPASAFAVALLGNRLLKKVTIEALQTIVGIMLILVALGLATGLI